MKRNLNFQRGQGRVLRENPFRGGGMDIFWNYMLHTVNYDLLVPTWLLYHSIHAYMCVTKLLLCEKLMQEKRAAIKYY